MQPSNWLVLARTPAEYQGVLAHLKTYDAKALYAFIKVFHFHPHKHPDLLSVVREEHQCPEFYLPVITRKTRLTRRESGTPVEIPANGPIQDVPTAGTWEGYCDIRIVVRRRTRWK